MDYDATINKRTLPYNGTLHSGSTLEELYCNASQQNNNLNGSYCRVLWDGVSCWPATTAGSTALVPCFSELNGVKYDVSDNASRECLQNATWSSWSNYRSCSPLNIPEDEYLEVLWDMRGAVTVYYVGYGFSLVALTIALWIFIYFKELRCIRNTIHANLMITYFLLAIIWMLTAKLQSSQNYVATRVACWMTIFLTYLMGTNFFWMFVEGLYLFILVVKTFTVHNIKIYFYAIIGWIIPAMIAATWAGVKGHFSTSFDILAPHECPWQKRDFYDYIFITPVVLVLLVNIIFLMKIMWVLITKLRATNQESEQCRKAAKALVVLIPLLGVTYILVIATPSHRTGEVVFTFIQATLLSTQGFTVAVLYCFLNGEVQTSVKTHIYKWRLRRGFNQTSHQSLSNRSSPRGDKLYRCRGVRDSSGSFATSTSFVTFSNTLRSPSIPQVNNCASIIEVPTQDCEEGV